MIEDIYKQIYLSIEEFNKEMNQNNSIPCNPGVQLFGQESGLGSLGLANLLILIEEHVNNYFNATIDLVSEHALNQKDNPYLSVESLARYIHHILYQDK